MSIHIGPDLQLTVVAREEIAPEVTTLTFQREAGFLHVPGQYVTVYFSDSKVPEGKAYTLVNAPHEPPMITVRRIGEFSNRIASLAMGDTLAVSNPYGFFCPEESQLPLILVAGGIGITPFRSIILDLAAHKSSRRVALFHSARKNLDHIFTELESANALLPGLSVARTVTREPPRGGSRAGRLTAKDILVHPNADIMLCGSTPFVRDLWRELTKLHVPANRISTEAFFQQ